MFVQSFPLKIQNNNDKKNQDFFYNLITVGTCLKKEVKIFSQITDNWTEIAL